MKTISRKQAIALNEKTYFTGVPCINGHIAKRYVQSSTCSECIHPRKTQSIEMLNAQIAHIESHLADLKLQRDNFNVPVVYDTSKRDVLAKFVRIRVAVKTEHFDIIQSIVLFRALAHHTDIDISEIWSRKAPKHSVLYEVLVHKDDKDSILKETSMIYSAGTDPEEQAKYKAKLDAAKSNGFEIL